MTTRGVQAVSWSDRVRRLGAGELPPDVGDASIKVRKLSIRQEPAQKANASGKHSMVGPRVRYGHKVRGVHSTHASERPAEPDPHRRRELV